MLAACAGPSLKLYTLAGPAPGGVSAPLGTQPVVIEVARVTLPDDLDTEDIVLREGSVLRRSATGRWGSRLSLEVTGLLARQLGERRPDALVTDVRQVLPPNERVLITISRLDIDASGSADIAADWLIVPQDPTLPPIRDRAQFHVSGPVGNDAQIVALETQLVERIASAINLPAKP
jgi:uncharacterized lipoprotein YmbA